ncbi:MAG TPA: hypothetical protein VLD40_01290 [Dissulfurispiraceae bacterium]|nr:hypothetical protein [Dissulfurispiraceae bacterium]
MNELVQRVIVEPFQKSADKILAFIPNILTSLVIFLAGILIGLLLRVVVARILSAMRTDGLAERLGLKGALTKGGVKEPLSVLLARAVCWLTIISFAILALHSLQAPAIERILEKFLLYLPNMVVALLILFFGYLLSNFLGRAALIAAVNAGLKFSGLVGKIVKLTAFMLAATMALEQLGIARATIVVAFAILFGGIVLALAIAFGFGATEIARAYLEHKIRGEDEENDMHHL